MPRAKKDHACLNIKIDAALYRKLMEVSEEAGQTKTMVVERALQGYFNDYDCETTDSAPGRGRAACSCGRGRQK